MARFFLIMLIMILLPFAAYWVRRSLAGETGEAEDVPTVPLLAAGLGLALISVLALVLTGTGGQRDGRYVPPSLEDGQIIPGHFEDEEPGEGEEDEPGFRR